MTLLDLLKNEMFILYQKANGEYTLKKETVKLTSTVQNMYITEVKIANILYSENVVSDQCGENKVCSIIIKVEDSLKNTYDVETHLIDNTTPEFLFTNLN